MASALCAGSKFVLLPPSSSHHARQAKPADSWSCSAAPQHLAAHAQLHRRPAQRLSAGPHTTPLQSYRPSLLQPLQASASGGANPPADLPSNQAPQAAGERQAEQEDEEEEDSHAGYAILHDFCMMIPYGALAFIAGLAMLAVPAPLRLLALPLAGAGAVAIASSVFSLKLWKQGQRSTPLTLTTAVCAGGAAYQGWLHTRAAMALGVGGPVIPWLAACITLLSGCLSAFCVYNVLAGGNPPRVGSH